MIEKSQCTLQYFVALQQNYKYMAKFCSHISHANLFKSLSQLNNNF